jgi:hypothetical protein
LGFVGFHLDLLVLGIWVWLFEFGFGFGFVWVSFFFFLDFFFFFVLGMRLVSVSVSLILLFVIHLLGLRALYFAISGMVNQFHYLKYGLAVILIFVGVKMIIGSYIHVC